MKKMLSTREVAQFLSVNEKMVYTLVAEKGLPATKITGKWLFPRHLVEQWIEANTINFPETASRLPPYHGLLILAGSNDLLLDRMISFYNTRFTDQVAVFGNLGSMGGLGALQQNFCHIAICHLLQDDEGQVYGNGQVYVVRKDDTGELQVKIMKSGQRFRFDKNGLTTIIPS